MRAEMRTAAFDLLSAAKKAGAVAAVAKAS